MHFLRNSTDQDFSREKTGIHQISVKFLETVAPLTDSWLQDSECGLVI